MFWTGSFLGKGSCPGPCRIFNSGPDPSGDKQKCLQIWPYVPWGTKSLSLENQCFKYVHFFSYLRIYSPYRAIDNFPGHWNQTAWIGFPPLRLLMGQADNDILTSLGAA